MSSSIYGQYTVKLFDNTTKIDWSSDTIKVSLHTSSYSPNIDSDEFWDDVTNEVSGTGYTTGGATLASKTITYDSSNNRVVIDAADTSWAGSTIANARYAVIYKSTGTPGTSPLIGYIDFGVNRSSSLSTFTIQWNTSGIIRASI